MGLNHMVSLSLSLAVLKNVVLSSLAASWSEPIVDSHHHQQVIFPSREWLLIMYRKSKWKCGYNLAVLGHGEFVSMQLLWESKLFYLHLFIGKIWRENSVTTSGIPSKYNRTFVYLFKMLIEISCKKCRTIQAISILLLLLSITVFVL